MSRRRRTTTRTLMGPLAAATLDTTRAACCADKAGWRRPWPPTPSWTIWIALPSIVCRPRWWRCTRARSCALRCTVTPQHRHAQRLDEGLRSGRWLLTRPVYRLYSRQAEPGAVLNGGRPALGDVEPALAGCGGADRHQGQRGAVISVRDHGLGMSRAQAAASRSCGARHRPGGGHARGEATAQDRRRSGRASTHRERARAGLPLRD